MKLRATLVFEYELTDDLPSRVLFYGTTDPEECAKIDNDTRPQELFTILQSEELITYKVEVV